MPRRGRRPGQPDTRTTILNAARRAFAERGYEGASIRRIAGAAEVDPALVHHYFGTKEELFLAAVRMPVDPATLIPQILAGDAKDLALRLVRTFLAVWEGPVSGPAMVSLLRRAVSQRTTGRLLREFFATQIVRQVVPRLHEDMNPSEAALRSSLVASQLFGLALTRYVLKLEQLADVPIDAVAAAAAPSVHRYLFEEIPR